jgi:hypothetical protein
VDTIKTQGTYFNKFTQETLHWFLCPTCNVRDVVKKDEHINCACGEEFLVEILKPNKEIYTFIPPAINKVASSFHYAGSMRYHLSMQMWDYLHLQTKKTRAEEVGIRKNEKYLGWFERIYCTKISFSWGDAWLTFLEPFIIVLEGRTWLTCEGKRQCKPRAP